jgi:2-polyprenyl-3-methyl-5-hydroxy-6-metoxy-1,4-benzoquinol methylase
MALDCVLPKLSNWGVEIERQKVLDVGCGAGGLTLALAENAADCLGIDLNPSHIAEASRLATERSVNAEFATADILKTNELDKILAGRSFQLIIFSEVLEHLLTLENVSFILSQLKKYLAPQGRVYVSFPPWFNPYGGHQAGWPIIRCVPWFHLLPTRIKQFIAPAQVEPYLAFFQELNHLTISSFERSARQAGLKIVKKELFHLRPEYYWRYRVPTIHSSIIGGIPGVREVTTTGAFYLLAAD